MAYLGTKPANQVIDSTLIADGTVTTSDIADNAITTAKIAAGAVVQADLASNVACTGPAFSAYPASNTTISSSTFTVMAHNTEEYDIGGCYNNTGSTVTLNGISVPAYSFAPNIAGYYLFSAAANTEFASAPTRCILMIAKNGSLVRVSENQTAATGVFGGSILYYLNGIGDYVNAQIWLAALTATYAGSLAGTRFQGSLVRAA
jgi:hypothetical protein